MSEWATVKITNADITPPSFEEGEITFSGPGITGTVVVELGGKKITVSRNDLAAAVRRLS